MLQQIEITTYCPRCSQEHVIQLPLSCTLETITEMLSKDGWGMEPSGLRVVCQQCVGSGGGEEDVKLGTGAVPRLDRRGFV